MSHKTAHKDTFTCTGSVRGNCGHEHRSIRAAVRCFLADHAACSRLGGGAYSDRCVVRCDGGDIDDDTSREIDNMIDTM